MVWSLPAAPSARFSKARRAWPQNAGLRRVTTAVLSSSGVLLPAISMSFTVMVPKVPTVKDQRGHGLGLPAQEWLGGLTLLIKSITAFLPRKRGWPGAQDVWQSHLEWTLAMAHQKALLLI